MELSDLEAVLARLSDEDRAEVTRLAAAELAKPFIPNPGPQSLALDSQADILLYGGAAGGGKSALEIGTFFDGHYSGLILRREATQLDGLIAFCKEIGEPEHGKFVGGSENVFKRQDGGRLKFAGLNQPDSWRKHAGNARDYMAFDEAGEFLKEQVFSLIGWLRSTREGQRCRVILGSNPPRGGDGEWLLEEFAPWLDPIYARPAKPGELRWAIHANGVTTWVDDDQPRRVAEDGCRLATPQEIANQSLRNEVVRPMSRTFIPARLDDNPYLKHTNYRAVLQGLPEPLRSQLLKGDFLAGREDHEWQVIPTAWVKEAQARWKPDGCRGFRMTAIACDVAQGGADETTLAHRYGGWFGELDAKPGVETPDPPTVAGLIAMKRRDNAAVVVDVGGGYGGGVVSYLKDNGTAVIGFNAANSSTSRTCDRQLTYFNKRAETWWKFREALDPSQQGGSIIALPPDPRLVAELTTARWHLTPRGILVEPKDKIRERIGRSTDRGDAVVMCWSEGEALAARQRRAGGGRLQTQAIVGHAHLKTHSAAHGHTPQRPSRANTGRPQRVY